MVSKTATDFRGVDRKSSGDSVEARMAANIFVLNFLYSFAHINRSQIYVGKYSGF